MLIEQAQDLKNQVKPTNGRENQMFSTQMPSVLFTYFQAVS